MAEEDPPDPPAGEPPAPGKEEPARPPREELYQAMWIAYRDGMREKMRLKRQFKVAWRLVDKAVETGWPELGWASLRSRLELWERQREAAKAKELAEADRRAAEKKGKDEAHEWRTFRPRAVKILVEGQEVLETLGAKLREAAKVASFIRYRRVRVIEPATGKMVTTDQAYVDGLAVTRAITLWASAAKETGTLMSFLTGGPSARIELPNLTPEQLEELRAGRLPEGISLEQVAQAVLAIGAAGGASE